MVIPFFQILQALRLFKALRLLFMTNLSGPKLIPCPTSIVDSRVIYVSKKFAVFLLIFLKNIPRLALDNTQQISLV